MLRSLSSAFRALRAASAIMAITALLCIAAASVSPAHTHLKDQADRCDICVTAHLASQQVAVIRVVHALELQRLLLPPVAVQRLESRGVLSSLTRGPPFSFNQA